MTSITLLCVLAACLSLGACYPVHASCKLTWKFPSTNCTFVHDTLVNEIKNRTGDPEDCGSSEKCLYKLVSETAGEIHSTHETPVKEYVDDQTFTLTGGSTDCSVAAYSTSETWYAVLDYGTNYCNLNNLATLSKLSAEKGFTEMTSDSMCTQYSSHNCDKY